jgi:hypothetical protein
MLRLSVHVLLIAVPWTLAAWVLPRAGVVGASVVESGVHASGWLMIAGIAAMFGAVTVMQVLLMSRDGDGKLGGIVLTGLLVLQMLHLGLMLFQIGETRDSFFRSSMQLVRSGILFVLGLFWMAYAANLIGTCAYAVQLERSSRRLRRWSGPGGLVIGVVAVIAMYGNLARRLMRPELYDFAVYPARSMEDLKWHSQLGDAIQIADHGVSILVSLAAVYVFIVLLGIRGKLSSGRVMMQRGIK